MIFLNGIRSIIEAMYLNMALTTDITESDIVVNPPKLLFKDKTIIVNDINFDTEYLEYLQNYNIIKSRVKLKSDKFNYRYTPYRADRIRKMHIGILPSIDTVTIGEDNFDMVRIFSTNRIDQYVTIAPYNLVQSRLRHGMSAFDLYCLVLLNELNNGTEIFSSNGTLLTKPS